MRERIYTIVARAKDGDRVSAVYDWYIMAIAVISVIPLAFRGHHPIFEAIETVTVYLLFLDYILNWMTYDYKRGKHTAVSFLLYPITPIAIMDILGILPTIGLLPSSFMILRLLRLVKIFQYSKSCQIIVNVFKNQRKTLLSVLTIAIAYIFISALIMFVHEPVENFEDFYDALYWATTALTTVGYGDVYPVTDIGKFISMLSSLFGVAVIAMPAGIVTAGFMDELNRNIEEKEEKARAKKEQQMQAQQPEQLEQKEKVQQLEQQVQELEQQVQSQKEASHE